jgi:hypothetical protein
MAQTLHKRKIAHGDLQSDNLKLRMNGAGPEFVLIDYDTLFVPGLAGAKATNAGVAGFQHPARAQAALASGADDYFSELVIYLTLRAVAEEPQLWDDYQMANREKELIFDAEDFHSSAPTERFRRLRNLSPPVGKLTLILWNYTRCGDIRWLLPIEEAAKLCCVCNITASKRSLQARKPKSEDWLTEWSSDGAPRALPPARVRGPSPLAGRSFKDLLCPGQNPTSGMGTMPTSSRETARPMRVLVFWGRLLLALVTLLIILNSPLRPRRDGGSAKPETTPSTVFPHDLPNRPTPEGISTRNNERKGGKIKVHRKQKGGRNRAYSD